MKKIGVRRSLPHYLMQLSLVDIVVLLLHAVSPRFSQMEWQILLVMGITSVTLNKSVSFFSIKIFPLCFVSSVLLTHLFPFVFVIFKALIALKKGTQLIKYSRKGKPKLCPFRISTVSYYYFLSSYTTCLLLNSLSNRFVVFWC